MELRKYSFIKSLAVKICAVFISLCSASSYASIIYSGIQNISFTAPTDISFTQFKIDLANDTSGTWDNIQFELANFYPGHSFGSSTSWSGSEVALAYESQLGLAQSYINNSAPTGSFGSGTEILWSFDSLNSSDHGMFKSGTAFAGIMLNSYESNSSFGYLYGWIQLKVDNYQNLDGTGATLTVVDWAYENTGTAINIGEGVKVPEPSTWLLTLAGLLFVFLRRPKQIVSDRPV